MSRYSIFDGGNVLEHYDSYSSGVVGYTNVRPANHHIDRKKYILFHVNTGSRPFTDDWNQLVIQNGDEMLTHVIGAGWVVTGVGLHIKSAGTGTITPKIELGNGANVAVVDYLSEGADSTAIDLSQLGYHWLRPNNTGVREVLNPSGVGYLNLTYTAATPQDGAEPAPMGGCFGVILEVIYLEDERECNCVTTPCPTVFPAPICSPSLA